MENKVRQFKDVIDENSFSFLRSKGKNARSSRQARRRSRTIKKIIVNVLGGSANNFRLEFILPEEKKKQKSRFIKVLRLTVI